MLKHIRIVEQDLEQYDTSKFIREYRPVVTITEAFSKRYIHIYIYIYIYIYISTLLQFKYTVRSHTC